MKPQVSIIIVNWNGKGLLRDCLGGLGEQVFRDFQIIVVDNGSSDGSVSFLKNNYPDIHIVELLENRGFCGGNSAGLEVASGRYIALLNNDTRPEPQWLSSLVEAMEADGRIGICASRLMRWGTEILDAAGDEYLTAGVALKRGTGEHYNRYQQREFVFGACAGAVLYRRKMLDEIGFFDREYFLVNEDTDLNFRAQLSGWKCLYVPDAVVYHKVSITRQRQPDLLVYYNIRNADFVLFKNMPLELLLRYLPQILIGQLATLIRFCIIQRQPGAYLKAKYHLLRALPSLRKKRKRVQEMRKVSNEYLESIFRGIWDRELIQKRLMNWRNPGKIVLH